MEEKTNLFNKVIFILDQNIRAVQYGTYTVAFIGLGIVLRNVRPFSKFRRPSDIPNRFIEQRITLKGTVERIEPNGALLMVQHRPLIRLIPRNKHCLPVKIAGVNVHGNGIGWLQTIVSGNDVAFVPILKSKEYVVCEVTLPQMLNKKLRNVNLGPSLISVGFATIAPIEKALASDPHHLKYYRQLMEAEKTHLRKQLGLWYYAKPTKEVSIKILNKMLSFFKKNPKTAKLTSS